MVRYRFFRETHADLRNARRRNAQGRGREIPDLAGDIDLPGVEPRKTPLDVYRDFAACYDVTVGEKSVPEALYGAGEHVLELIELRGLDSASRQEKQPVPVALVLESVVIMIQTRLRRHVLSILPRKV